MTKMITDILNMGQRVAGDVINRAGRFARIPGAKPDMDDQTLHRKVESIVLRPEGAPKGSVNVNVADGVVYLRGEVKRPEQIKALESAVRGIPEVRGVENLLHLPKTPAPTRADTPKRQQKTRRTAPKSAKPGAAKPTPRVTAERKTAKAEPGPDELAAKRKGRQPAPLGSKDTGGGS